MKSHKSRRHNLAYIITICLTLAVSDAQSSSCVENKGSLESPMDYGSAEQIKDLKATLQSGCDVIGRAWSPLNGTGKFLILDSNANVLVRITVRQAVTPSWETWSGFTAADISNDDPADGYDLANYTVEQDNLPVANRVVTPAIEETINRLNALVR